MKPRLLTLFKKRFEKINKIEELEVKKTSLKQKFRQLSSLISMAIGLGLNLNKYQKERRGKTNWELLKT